MASVSLTEGTKRYKLILGAIIILAVIIRLVFVFAVPAWHSPDEYAHYWVIEQVAETGELPVADHSFPNYEAFQPPLYYVIASPIIMISGGGAGFTEDIISPPLGLVMVRLFSVLLGLLTIFVCYRISGRLSFVKPIDRLVATGVVAFLPTFVGVTSSVNNDCLVILFSSLVIYYILNPVWTKRNALLTGVFLGLAILSKMNGLVLLPIVLFRAWQISGNSLSSMWNKLSGVLPGLLIALVIIIVRNLLQYGDPLALNPGAETGNGYDITNIARAVKNLAWSFWFAFGPAYRQNLPMIVYIMIFFPMTVIAVFGWYRKLSNSNEFRTLAIVAVGSSIVASLYYTLSYPAGTMTSWGKNIYPVLSIIALLLAVGWRTVSVRFAHLLPVISVVVLFIASVWAGVIFLI